MTWLDIFDSPYLRVIDCGGNFENGFWVTAQILPPPNKNAMNWEEVFKCPK